MLVKLVCSMGHEFELEPPQYPDEVIGAIAPCQMALCTGVIIWNRPLTNPPESTNIIPDTEVAD